MGLRSYDHNFGVFDPSYILTASNFCRTRPKRVASSTLFEFIFLIKQADILWIAMTF